MHHGAWVVHNFCVRLSTANFVTQEHYPTAGHPASSTGWELAFSGGVSTHGRANTNRVLFVYVIWFLRHLQGHRASLPASLPVFSQCKLRISSCFVSDLLFQEMFRHLHATVAGRTRMAEAPSRAKLCCRQHWLCTYWNHAFQYERGVLQHLTSSFCCNPHLSSLSSGDRGLQWAAHHWWCLILTWVWGLSMNQGSGTTGAA